MKKELKRKKPITVQPKYLAMAIAILLFAQLYHWFFQEYRLQSPIVIEVRSPITEKYVSPIPSGITVMPLESPKEATESATLTPTPTPEKKALKIDIVPDVVAAEIPSDTQIIDYICSKDWDCETAVAIAKSENFWNLTKSFDCSRTGGVNKNGTRDHGLWQINDIHITSGAITLEDAHNCYAATDFAYGLYKGRGNFSAWSAYNNGSYLAHL